MIRQQAQVAFLRRTPRRKQLLAYLSYLNQPLELYQAFEFPAATYPKAVYPRRRRYNLLLIQGTFPTPVTVPNVVGMTQSNAVFAISSLGLVITNISFVNSNVPAGLVISQSPVGGTSLPIGGAVTLVVSLGPLSGFRVQAISAGEYNGQYYVPGDVFDITLASDYSDSTQNYEAGGEEYAPGWMLAVPSTTPLYQWVSATNSPYFPATDPARRFVL